MTPDNVDLDQLPGYIEHNLAGSTAILGNGADVDYMVLVDEGHLTDAVGYLRGQGYVEDCVGCRYKGDFRSLRNGIVNVIVFEDDRMYYERVAAFRIARYLHQSGILPMTSKAVRVALHQVASGEAIDIEGLD